MESRNVNYIFLHGLGQTAASWDKVFSVLRISDPVCPDLFSMLKGQNINYPNLFKQFEKNCNEYHGKVSICGISFGGSFSIKLCNRAFAESAIADFNCATIQDA